MKLTALLCLVALLSFGIPAHADYGSGCPVWAFAGMKVFEDENGNQIPHHGQWFTASYVGGLCGENESNVLWSVSEEPPASDVCFGAADYVATQALGIKRCARERGKIFWLPPGTWTLTACAPPVVEGVCAGSWTIENFVVD